VQVRTWYIHDHFFLWVFLKETVYSNNQRGLEELKHSIEQTVANSDQETLRKVELKTADACFLEGGHFQYLL
jgi:hypothetical protein